MGIVLNRLLMIPNKTLLKRSTKKLMAFNDFLKKSSNIENNCKLKMEEIESILQRREHNKSLTTQVANFEIKNTPITSLDIERFWLKVNKTESCWEWKSYKDKIGYGVFKIKSITCNAHRFSWTITNGTIDKGQVICHKCDNPSCVNPEHLFIGTQLDNIKDRDNKDRVRNGNTHPHAKLNYDLVKLIKELHNNGMSQQNIIKELKLDIDNSTLSRVISGKIWARDIKEENE